MKTTEQILQNNQVPAQLTQEQAELLINEANRIKAEREALKGKDPEQVIEFYLDFIQSRDREFNEKYPINKLGKTIKDCYNYILDRVKKECNSSAAMVQHTTVFEYAKQYFMDDNIQKFKGAASGKAVINNTPKTKEEKIKLYNDWENAHKIRVENWEKHHQEEIDKWNREHQLELFYNPDDNPHLKDINPYTDEKNPYYEPDKDVINEKDNDEDNNE